MFVSFTVPVIFFGSVLYARVCFGMLAIQWPTLMRHWENVENSLPSYKSQREKSHLAYKIKIVSIIVMTLSLGIFSI